MAAERQWTDRPQDRVSFGGRFSQRFWGVKRDYYSDMGAFRAIRREALMSLGMREMTFGWNLEMQAKAARRGLRVLEIPVPYSVRYGGQSKVAGSLGGTESALRR